MAQSDKNEPGALRRRVARLIRENRRLKNQAQSESRSPGPCAQNPPSDAAAALAGDARCRTILEKLPVPLVLHDSEGRFFFMNRAFTCLFGYTLEDVPTLADWFPRAYPNPSYRRRVIDMRNAREEALKAGRHFEPVDLKVCCKDGSFRTVRIDAGPIGDRFSGAHFVTLFDLTEREKSLKKIRELEGALQEHVVVAVTDAAGVIREVNEKFCELSKYKREELIGRTHRIVNSGYHTPEFFRKLWSTIQSGSVWRGILRNRAKDGSLYWVETTIVPVFGEDGLPESYIALRTDITDLVYARDAAQSASRAKTEFLAMMSHELRTPLNGIMGVLSLLRQADLDPVQRERIDIAQRSSEILLGLISNLLDHLRLEAGKANITEEAVDIRGLLGHLLAIVRAASVNPRLGFEMEVAEAVPALVSMDKGKLSQVILNLLGNAAKFTHEGNVKLAAEVVPGSRLVFEVSDTGIGFEESDLPRLFEPYSQLSAGSRYGGAGLGLSISRQLVNLMGGSISARSQKNVGSVFTVSLPLRLPAASESRTAAPVIPARRTGTVLVAEDNELNLRILTQMLEALGCKARAARNGLEAVDAARSGCDLILMDIQMPEMDGVEAARRIRHNAALPRIPIVALTADAWDERMNACAQAGMDGFIAKPVTLDQLRDILDKYLPVN